MNFTPTEAEQQQMDARAKALVAAVQAACNENGIKAKPTIQGSVAKGTWLPGSVDLDCFVLMPESTPESDLKTFAETIGLQVLKNPRKKYAQHPYLLGEFEGAEVDLVPAYNVQSADAILSAVDRTPFHTDWVNANLSVDQKRDLREWKAWCKGVGVYGAETKIGGFSGYLLEVVLAKLGSLQHALEWLAKGDATRIHFGNDAVEDKVSHWVVVDPVDPTRNCAAAVTKETFAVAGKAAKAYLESPTKRFFEPVSPTRDGLEATLASQDATWIGLTLQPETDRLDIVFPQFQRAGRLLRDGFERHGFPVLRHNVDEIDGTVVMQWVTKNVQPPQTRLQKGPRADKEDNVKKFKAKWQPHADRIGEFEEENGNLQVLLRNPIQTPQDALQALIQRGGYAKHFQNGLKHHEILTEPKRAPATWNISDCIRNQHPWERTS